MSDEQEQPSPLAQPPGLTMHANDVGGRRLAGNDLPSWIQNEQTAAGGWRLFVTGPRLRGQEQEAKEILLPADPKPADVMSAIITLTQTHQRMHR